MRELNLSRLRAWWWAPLPFPSRLTDLREPNDAARHDRNTPSARLMWLRARERPSSISRRIPCALSIAYVPSTLHRTTRSLVRSLARSLTRPIRSFLADDRVPQCRWQRRQDRGLTSNSSK